MWSGRSVTSRYVKDEATYALNKRKLVPVAIEEVELPLRFAGLQTPRLTGWDGSADASGFRRLVGRTSRRRQPLDFADSEVCSLFHDRSTKCFFPAQTLACAKKMRCQEQCIQSGHLDSADPKDNPFDFWVGYPYMIYSACLPVNVGRALTQLFELATMPLFFDTTTLSCHGGFRTPPGFWGFRRPPDQGRQAFARILPIPFLCTESACLDDEKSLRRYAISCKVQ
jgi:hypothetical protein